MKTLSVIKPINHDPRYGEMSKDQAWIEIMDAYRGAYYFNEICNEISPLFAYSNDEFWDLMHIKSRKHGVCQIKQMAFHIMRVMPCRLERKTYRYFPLERLAEITDEYHGTLMHGIKRIKGLIETNDYLRDIYYLGIEKLRTLC